MTATVDTQGPASRCPFERVLGTYDSGQPGPTIVVTGGLHGNEPAGALAIREVLSVLAKRRPSFAGRLVGLTGNRLALARGCRFVHRDLNRRWFASDIAGLKARDPAEDTAEDGEQRELLRAFDEAIASSDGPAVFIDLHSTSGEGPPFACMSDTLRNRRIALALGLPVILGLEEVIDGSMLGYLSDQGHCGVAVEGGQQGDAATQHRHVSALWIALVAAGALAPEDAPELAAHRARLASSSDGLPRVVEVLHRHVVEPDDEFVMNPGFASFQPIRVGDPLARDRDGAIHAKQNGRILLPRYQGQGEDGFFIVRDVSPAWLHVSAALRRLRLDGLVPLLPGVAKHPSLPDHYVVDRQTARHQAVNVLHLFGYRLRAAEGDRLIVSRRRQRAS